MARPLPPELEKQIAGVAKRSEIRSVAIFAFILGGIVGFAAAVAFLGGATASFLPFGVVLVIVLLVWFFAGRRPKH